MCVDVSDTFEGHAKEKPFAMLDTLRGPVDFNPNKLFVRFLNTKEQVEEAFDPAEIYFFSTEPVCFAHKDGIAYFGFYGRHCSHGQHRNPSVFGTFISKDMLDHAITHLEDEHAADLIWNLARGGREFGTRKAIFDKGIKGPGLPSELRSPDLLKRHIPEKLDVLKQAAAAMAERGPTTLVILGKNGQAHPKTREMLGSFLDKYPQMLGDMAPRARKLLQLKAA